MAWNKDKDEIDGWEKSWEPLIFEGGKIGKPNIIKLYVYFLPKFGQ